MVTYSDFTKLDIRVGVILKVENFPEARSPSYKLTIDFGKEIGIKKSSAHLPLKYSKEDLVSRQILAVINFPQKQIGTVMSEVLVLGVPDEDGECVLVRPECKVPLGGRLY